MATRPSGIITLITDFGVDDVYVGVMKGVIAGIEPSARVVDLTHAIKPFDALDAAIVLRDAYAWFPPGTVHVVVVDPGVGSDRGIVAMAAKGHVFLAPDTGILAPVAADAERSEIVRVTNSDLFLPEVSATFQGRDIFAPVAARLAGGAPLTDLGPPLERLQPLDLPEPERAPDGGLRGVVVRSDRFGNLITNIPGEAVAARAVRVRVGARRIEGLSRSFADAAPGEWLAYIGSFGRLEVAANRGNARGKLGAFRGDAVFVDFEDSQE